MVAKNKKASLSSEVVMGQASANLKKGLTELKAVAEKLETLQNTSDDLQLTIAEKEGKIEELNVQFAEKQRAHEVELGLKVRESIQKVTDSFLDSHQLVAVPKQELDSLKSANLEWELKFDERVKQEVAKASGGIASNFTQKEKLLEADYRAKEAQNLASIKTLEAQVVTLTTQNKQWEAQLNAERQASVERARHGAVGSINVGQDAKR